MSPTHHRPSQATIKADRLAVQALQRLDVYRSFDPAFDLSTVQSLLDAYDRSEEAERQAVAALAAARNQRAEAAAALHGAVSGVKLQILAQFGPDSPAVRSFGLVRRSDRRSPTRKPRQSGA